MNTQPHRSMSTARRLAAVIDALADLEAARKHSSAVLAENARIMRRSTPRATQVRRERSGEVRS